MVTPHSGMRPDESFDGQTPGGDFQAKLTREFEQLDLQLRNRLERLAWVILRDWPLAADAVQEAFLVLHQKWTEIGAEFRVAWLVKSVQLKAHNLRRRQTGQQALLRRIAGRERLSGTATQPPPPADERLERLTMAIARLPEKQQQLLRLRMVEGMTFQQIADRLEIPLGTALSRMRLALSRLRKLVDDE